MLERHFSHYLCLLLGLLMLSGFSVVHSAGYSLEGKGTFTRPSQSGSSTELSKLFTYKATLYPKNDGTKTSFGKKVKISATSIHDEKQQDIEVTANGIKWMAIVHEGKVTHLKHIANDTSIPSALVSAVLSLAPQADQAYSSSSIQSLMKKIYRECLAVYKGAVKQDWESSLTTEHAYNFE